MAAPSPSGWARTADPFDLSGKVAPVTGGNGGMRLGLARAVGRAGAAVAVCGTNPARNAAAVARLPIC